MSSDSYSDVRTLRFSETAYNLLPGKIQNIFITKGIDTKAIDLALRKSSHFIEYMVLSITLFVISRVYKIKTKVSVIYILFICLLIANLDEFYQSFVPGRNSQVRDCLIDLLGSLTGLIICFLLRKLKKINKK
ncbi:hypothetical protein Ami3637_01745 [Aminipila terrae]|uniref:VanZ-like domain-containing protein n=2 Tax=Aminipila terrae TaxID=2697030 RepID=A0A6P1M980_9FIRM|nr:hypothetical protein Ami3637_01745 [Aminipila terrae]